MGFAILPTAGEKTQHAQGAFKGIHPFLPCIKKKTPGLTNSRPGVILVE
jgi:hypothetical protein